MAIEKTNSEITPDIESRLEKLAEFISTETAKSDNAANVSNWLIFERYNREFNAIALQMGYDVAKDGNEDWTASKAINSQLIAPEWYEGKSRAWLQQCRRILRTQLSINRLDVLVNKINVRYWRGGNGEWMGARAVFDNEGEINRLDVRPVGKNLTR